VGGAVRRWRAALAASILAVATALIAGSCWNPLNDVLSTWAHLDMVKVPGGTLTLGNDGSLYTDEWPPHDVTLATFYISRFEITQQLFDTVMSYNPSYSAPRDDTTLPVEQVWWQTAVLFCNKLSKLAGYTPCYVFDYTGNVVTWDLTADGYRLPTEAEWEYAASGGQWDNGYQFAGSSNIDEVGWYVGNTDSDGTFQKTKPVGSLSTNELGLYDMSGNVFEWCWDGYDGSDYASIWPSSTNPLGVNGNVASLLGADFIFRGGSVNQPPDDLRVERRRGNVDFGPGGIGYVDVGFRVVRNQ
jgi:sulfatase modifying factor 1